MNNDLDLNTLIEIDKKIEQGESVFSPEQLAVNNLIYQITDCPHTLFGEESCEFCRGEDPNNNNIYKKLEGIQEKIKEGKTNVIIDRKYIDEVNAFSSLTEKQRKDMILLKKINSSNKRFYCKPETYKEIEALVNSGSIEIMLQAWNIEGDKMHFLICDHRRTYEEGEIYEVIVTI